MSSLTLPSQHPIGLSVARAKGAWIEDPDGARYLDMIAGISVSPLGHGHPKVLEALRRASEEHLHVMVYGEYLQEAQERMAEELTSLLPSSLNKAYFVNSGTEANEAAVKLAKAYSDRPHIAYFSGAYHGHTQGSLSISDQEDRKRHFRPLDPGVQRLEFNDPEDLKRIDERTAAVVLEPVQGDAGVRIPDGSFMKALRERCDRTGSLLILDEIQCGLGRTGKWWGFEHYGIEADILSTAKALGGGLPLGGIVANEEVLDTFSKKVPLGHLTSTGGHPLSCATGCAVIEAIREEGVLSRVEAKGASIEKELQHPRIRALRRKGLMIGIDLEDEQQAQTLVRRARQKGVLLFNFLSHPRGVRIAPPLNLDEKDLEWGCERIREVLDEL